MWSAWMHLITFVILNMWLPCDISGIELFGDKHSIPLDIYTRCYCALFCLVIIISVLFSNMWFIYQYSSKLIYWHRGNHMTANEVSQQDMSKITTEHNKLQTIQQLGLKSWGIYSRQILYKIPYQPWHLSHNYILKNTITSAKVNEFTLPLLRL